MKDIAKDTTRNPLTIIKFFTAKLNVFDLTCNSLKIRICLYTGKIAIKLNNEIIGSKCRKTEINIAIKEPT